MGYIMELYYSTICNTMKLSISKITDKIKFRLFCDSLEKN